MATASLVSKLSRQLARLENGTLIFILTITIVLAVLQIFLRNALQSGLPWIDPLVRILVLWLGLIGAMIATRERRHIRIDILSRYLGPVARRWSNRITDVIATSVCGVIAWYGVEFVYFEYQDGMRLFGGIPVWLSESIIPFAFFIMAMRYLLSALAPQQQRED